MCTRMVILLSMLCGWTMAQTPQNETKVNVTVYYEALCPDSLKFISTQLYPALTKPNSTLPQHVTLRLVPAGKSKSMFNRTNGNGVYNFVCHHGEDECVGNRLHACGLHHIPDGTANVEDKPVTRSALTFVNCLMVDVDRSQSPNVYPTKRCAEKGEGVNYSMVENCAKHVDGQKYFAHYIFMTDQLRPALTSVPTITIDNEVRKDAEGNFVGAVCGALQKKGLGELPAECGATGTAARAVTASMALVLIACFLNIGA